jgi:zinc transporter 1/2/3
MLATDVVWVKLGAFVSIFLTGLAAGALPLLSHTCTKSPAVLSVANVFAAGVFLAVGVCHLLPEAAQEIRAAHGQLDDRFPVAFLLFIGGYTVILVIDRVIFSADGHGHGHGHGPTAAPAAVEVGKVTNSSTPLTANGNMYDDINANCEGPVANPGGSQIPGYILLLALSIHGTAEGMALGLQDHMGDLLALFVAIIAHKWAESLALGIAFTSSTLPCRRALGLVTMFALSTPVGLLLGMGLRCVLSPLAVSYTLATAAGSFLYIGASDVVVAEFVAGRSNWTNLFFFLLGLGLMVLLKGLTHDPH